MEESDPKKSEELQKQNPLMIPLSIIIAGALVGAGIYFSKANPANIKGSVDNKTEVLAGSQIKPVTSLDHILGNPNAEIFIVEYSDTECPFCKSFHQTMKRIISEYGSDGSVAWVYRHFPIDQLHSRARKEAEATECVAELGGNSKFWEYVDEIYKETNSNNTLDPSALPRIAESIGIDQSDFNDCLSSGKYSGKILSSVQEAIKSGAKGTPFNILIRRDGQSVALGGALPYDTLKPIIETALTQE